MIFLVISDPESSIGAGAALTPRVKAMEIVRKRIDFMFGLSAVCVVENLPENNVR